MDDNVLYGLFIGVFVVLVGLGVGVPVFLLVFGGKNRGIRTAHRILWVLEVIFGILLLIPWIWDFFSPSHSLVYDVATFGFALFGAYLIKKGITNIRG